MGGDVEHQYEINNRNQRKKLDLRASPPPSLPDGGRTYRSRRNDGGTLVAGVAKRRASQDGRGGHTQDDGAEARVLECSWRFLGWEAGRSDAGKRGQRYLPSYF